MKNGIFLKNKLIKFKRAKNISITIKKRMNKSLIFVGTINFPNY